MSVTTTINVYPSLLPGRPLERHYTAGTLHAWLCLNVPEYRPDGPQPVVATMNGRLLPVELWDDASTVGQVIDLRPVPQAGLTMAAVGKYVTTALISAAISYVLTAIFAKKPRGPDNRAVRDMAFADVRANTVRLNQVIPDIAGRVRRYPDYLCQPRRWFVDEHTQAINLMLAIGVGEYAREPLQIADTPVDDLPDVTYAFFAPGADVSGNAAHENWYNAKEVGATSGGSGIRLQSGETGTQFAEADRYTLTGSSIIVLPGAGAMPQDWEVGNVVTIAALTRSLTIVDGGGTLFAPNRDLVRCDLTGLSLTTGAEIMIEGAGSVDGHYRVHSLTTNVVEPGSASHITGTLVAELDFDSSPVTLFVAGQTVLLDEDFADADALVAAMNAQIGGATVTHTAGVVTITDDSPFDGRMISLSGNYAPVLGATPYSLAGTASASYDELTLDKWQTSTDAEGNTSGGWVASGSLPVGVFPGVSIERAGVTFRIADVVTGPLPDGDTGAVGFDFERLNPDGSDDTGWAGFFPETTTSEVTIKKVSGVTGGWVGPFAVSPPDALVSVIEYDIFAPSGIVRFNREGKIKAHVAACEVQWSADGVAWTSISHSMTRATQDPLGWTHRITPVAPVRNVMMRVRRIGAEAGSSQYSDRLEWFGARSKLPAATSYAGVTTLAMQIVGSDVIAAQSQNMVNLYVTRKLNGVATRGIADYALYLLDQVGYPENRIDTDEFERLADIWAARGDTFDYEFAEQMSAREALEMVLAAGFVNDVTIHHGLLLPVRDEPRAAHAESYSLQNMTMNGALVRAFTLPQPTDFDGVDVTFRNEDTDVDEVVECRLAGDLGIKTQRVTAHGIRNRDKAWRFGMRIRRRLAYQRWTYRWETELDALNSYRGALVAVFDDVPGYGRSAILLDFEAAGSTVRLWSTEVFAWPDPMADCLVGWRMPDGKLAGPYPAAAGATPDEIVATGVPTDKRPVLNDLQEPPHVYFGPVATWCHSVIVREVVPDGMRTARVEGVNYDVRIYADDDNEPE